MLFADLELARRLERPEAIAGTAFVEARRRVSPETGAEWMESGGVYAMFDGPGSPVTQTFGLGLYQDATVADLEKLEEFFHSRGAEVCHEVSPLSGVALAELLCRRGYLPTEFTNVLYQPLEHHAPAAKREDSPVHVRLMKKGEEELWSRVSARGWVQEADAIEFMVGFGKIMAARDEALIFFGEIDGVPVGTGVLHCEDGVALLGGASTVPEARKQGVQNALFEARMKMAIELGCDLAMICAAPGSSSQRNAERQGFRVAYTRTKWRLALNA